MGVPFAGAALFTGLTGLPHPDWLVHHATWLMNTASGDPCPPEIYPTHAQRSQCEEQVANIQGGVQTAENLMIGILVFIVGLFVFQIVAMCLYKSKVHDNKPAIPEDDKTMKSGDFHFGLFACFSNCNECLCSFCCSGLRFADTHASVTTTGFWTSFLGFFGATCVISALANAIAVAVDPGTPLTAPSQSNISLLLNLTFRGLVFGLYSRGEIRKKLGSPVTNSSKAVDILSWAICFPCAMTQEAVEVDIAADVHIACPWTLTKPRANGLGVKAREVAPAEYEAMVGDAVLLDGR